MFGNTIIGQKPNLTSRKQTLKRLTMDLKSLIVLKL